ncbi:hypothetical protein [Paenibacillus tuaregi]|uniref:hypothetical protein n=1 Tax=Paenibacillus tuaregi TaxID=1816681 RepID=UPI000838739B|nr:hypothetical protein [Paenibacillus tuaregi]
MQFNEKSLPADYAASGYRSLEAAGARVTRAAVKDRNAGNQLEELHASITQRSQEAATWKKSNGRGGLRRL